MLRVKGAAPVEGRAAIRKLQKRTAQKKWWQCLQVDRQVER